MNGLAGGIQTFARTCPIPRGRSEQNARKVDSMGLFKPDLYRSFFLGFGLTALALAVKIVPQLI
jgi:hypothetical protein